ncbi:DoxX family protein [Hymenobacter sp. HSC-4F20]|uniref:DoxX family protein n=1 Tax=Hymenobacter sp. HSC-4F20 TaxID=2864135 RepID=UPI001C73ADA9|nr:DoxX family protein [Hymenobacter sp. HSC-4F20]MBX0292286.1 DoxX family protein [Hymenobacter sp. HSC-4F20]
MELSHRFPAPPPRTQAPPRRNRTSAGNPVWLDGLRILLGLFLLIKGLSFLDNSSDVFYLLSQQQSVADLRKASLFISFFHIMGGALIMAGSLTRLALLLQIPILLGAVLLVNFRNGLALDNTERWVSAVVLVLCLLFMVVGPGRYSVDNKIFRDQSRRDVA